MEKCQICNHEEISYICVCEEKMLCSGCLVSHKTNTKGHRPVSISHPLLSLMYEANSEVKESPTNLLPTSLDDQIKYLEKIRDDHYQAINDKIQKLRLQLDLSFKSVKKHKKSLSTGFNSETAKSGKFNLTKSFKLAVAGDKGTGKSTFESAFIRTQSASNSTNRLAKIFKFGNRFTNLALSFIPSNGHRSLRNSYFFKACGLVFLFDLTNRSSLYSLDGVVQEAKQEIKKDFVLVIIGTRLDLLQRYPRSVSVSEIENLASNYGAKYFEVNLLDEEAVQSLIRELAKLLSEGY